MTHDDLTRALWLPRAESARAASSAQSHPAARAAIARWGTNAHARRPLFSHRLVATNPWIPGFRATTRGSRLSSGADVHVHCLHTKFVYTYNFVCTCTLLSECTRTQAYAKFVYTYTACTLSSCTCSLSYLQREVERF